MKMALDGASGVNTIASYTPGRVAIQGRSFTASLIVLPDRLLTDWAPKTAAELDAIHLETITDTQPEVVILGTGETQVFPDPAILAPLMRNGIGFELMSNAAACRTYNVLLAEGRRAALGLLFDGSGKS
mgnify:CR=1 FL=1